jgi:hypothetical protein
MDRRYYSYPVFNDQRRLCLLNPYSRLSYHLTIILPCQKNTLFNTDKQSFFCSCPKADTCVRKRTFLSGFDNWLQDIGNYGLV